MRISDWSSDVCSSDLFSENIILGKMAVTLLSSAGADVIDLTNIPGSSAARQAHLEGQVDAMWEYTGTGWITYLGHDKPIPDEKEQYLAVRDEDLAKNGLAWLPAAPMNKIGRASWRGRVGRYV